MTREEQETQHAIRRARRTQRPPWPDHPPFWGHRNAILGGDRLGSPFRFTSVNEYTDGALLAILPVTLAQFWDFGWRRENVCADFCLVFISVFWTKAMMRAPFEGVSERLSS
ncbi:MAG: hypothetical protein CM15mP120_22980 [Pseudomonadota bacterium]|nr:MAG: hypothetical protein CM15mP120_22980 [Pseudomonadota bacterium]